MTSYKQQDQFTPSDVQKIFDDSLPDSASVWVACELNAAWRIYQSVNHLDGTAAGVDEQNRSIAVKKGLERKGLLKLQKWINRTQRKRIAPVFDKTFRQKHGSIFGLLREKKDAEASDLIDQKIDVLKGLPESHSVSYAEKILIGKLLDVWESTTGIEAGINRDYERSGPSPAIRFVLDCCFHMGAWSDSMAITAMGDRVVSVIKQRRGPQGVIN